MTVDIKREYDARMWIHLAQDRSQWKTVVQAVLNRRLSLIDQ